MTELIRSEVAERAPRIDECQHHWAPNGKGEVHCKARCDAVLLGSLAAEPPAAGMDWNQNVLVQREPAAAEADMEAER
jgi:hypothetical protein